MRTSIHRRLAALEAWAPRPQRPLVRPEFVALLNEITSRKRAGTLTPEDEAFLDAAKAEVKRRRDAGLIG